MMIIILNHFIFGSQSLMASLAMIFWILTTLEPKIMCTQFIDDPTLIIGYL